MSDNAPVALPAFGCYDLATAVLGSGVKAVLYDIDPETLAPDLESLREALGRGARSVVCASFYGLSTRASECAALASSAGAILIMDAAQSWGAVEGGRWSVASGSVAVLSFGRGKGYTGGGGGALLAHDSLGAQLVAQTVSDSPRRRGGDDWARAAALWLLGRPSWYAIPASIPQLGLGVTRFNEPRPPGRMSEACASILCRNWSRAAREVAIRRRNAARLLASLRGHPTLRSPRGGADSVPSYLRLPVLATGAGAAYAAGKDARNLGIVPSYPRILSELPAFADSIENSNDDWPGARRLASALHTIPTHGLLSDCDLVAIERWIRLSAVGPAAPRATPSGAEEELEAEMAR